MSAMDGGRVRLMRVLRAACVLGAGALGACGLGGGFVATVAHAQPGQSADRAEPDGGLLPADIAQKEAEHARALAEIEALGERRRATREQLRQRTRALYRVTRSGMLPLAGGFDALLGHYARVERLERMVENDLKSLTELGRRGGALRARSAVLGEEIEAARRRHAEFEADVRAREEQARAAAALAGPYYGAASSEPVGYEGSRGSPDGYGSIRIHGEPAARSDFAALRGHLSMPIAGSVDVREGRREDGLGLEFLAAPGLSVRAAAEGRVAFAQRYASYGLLVILDHGDGYFTVYGGLGTAHVQVGDVVTRGGGLGTVGTDGPSQGMYFEVRRHTRALDAPSWLGL